MQPLFPWISYLSHTRPFYKCSNFISIELRNECVSFPTSTTVTVPLKWGITSILSCSPIVNPLSSDVPISSSLLGFMAPLRYWLI
uniref:Uncharacterized protein n=1 Tax=Rhizophora mucronata TaxID=61149 RepID=A0A2P2Q2X6_RHIMU